MDKKLEKILGSIELSPEDENKFGESALQRIKSIKSLHNPDNNFETLKEYLVDEIDFLNIKIAHNQKYSPEVYHSNVALSSEFEAEVYQNILDRLSGL